MTLTQFLTTTGAISDRNLRPALAGALGEEIPRSRDSFGRFLRTSHRAARRVGCAAARGVAPASVSHPAVVPTSIAGSENRADDLRCDRGRDDSARQRSTLRADRPPYNNRGS